MVYLQCFRFCVFGKKSVLVWICARDGGICLSFFSVVWVNQTAEGKRVPRARSHFLNFGKTKIQKMRGAQK